ncbi:MAG: DUF2961 domain-containing protein [Verrucomicrobia bacterium]|nr:DUF2961 domain-containing protein [Verrucomicrobiota bacterium]
MKATVVLGCCLIVAGNAGAAVAPVSFSSLLREMVDRDAAARRPAPAYTCAQASSYDRASTSPDKPETWWANGDRSHFVRSEKNEGREEWVLMDAAGPGAIVRFWITADKPAGQVRIYLDGAAAPAVVAPVEDLVGGTALVGPPLSAERARGRNLYLPIPYARHCKVTFDRPNFNVTKDRRDLLYYQINYRTYPAGTAVETFTPGSVERARALVAEVQSALLEPGRAVPAGLTGRDLARHVAPGETATLSVAGPGAIRRLAVQLQAANLELATRQTVLEAAFDGEEGLWCPVGDFFGSGVGVNPFKDWWREVTAERRFTSYWVMPYERAAEVRLRNAGKQPVEVTLRVEHGPWQWDGRSMHFRANWRQEGPLDARKKFDWNYLTAQGEGVYMGDTLCLVNPVLRWWGEGDEKVYVDGESFPSHFGTGTEDYYGYAWCTPQVFDSPFHAQPRAQGPNNFGHVTNTRVRLLDGIPFRTALRFDMEVWHSRPCEIPYAVATYWYARPGARAEPRPREDALQVFSFPAPAADIRTVSGALEGETLRVEAVSGGKTQVQAITAPRWSGGKQLWWMDGQPGDRLTLVFTVERAGRYQLQGEFTQARDYGAATVAVDAGPASAPIDFYSATLTTQVRDLGTHTLSAGPHRLTITLAAPNPRALPRRMIGIDYLKLTPASP